MQNIQNLIDNGEITQEDLDIILLDLIDTFNIAETIINGEIKFYSKVDFVIDATNKLKFN